MNNNEVIEFRINQFVEFYNCLMGNASANYKPWFFPCEANGKNPDALAIIKLAPEKSLCCESEWVKRFTKKEEAMKNKSAKINPKWRCDNCEKTKGSWHQLHAKLSKEQCIERIKLGGNLGISARENDCLIIGDIDELEYLSQIPKDTLTVTSRKRDGGHFFGWDKDGSAKINQPTDYGELRSSNQYVLACGSWVGFDHSFKKDRDAFAKLTKETQEDNLLGFYTIREGVSPRDIGFDDLPEFFKEAKRSDEISDSVVLQREEKNKYNDKAGKYSELFKLKVSDIVGDSSSMSRTGHPLHESDTDANWSLSEDGSLGNCWRHGVSLNAVQYLCVKAGYSNCQDAGIPHNSKKPKFEGRKFSKLKGDKKAFSVAYDEALKLGLIEKWDDTMNNLSSKIGDAFNKKDLARRIIEVQPCYYDKYRIWWLWNNEKYKWQKVDEVDILNVVDDKAAINTINSKEKNEMIEALKQVSRLHRPIEIKKTWIQFKDKIFDIETGETFEASAKYFITNPIEWELSDEKETPVMDKIFTEWVGEKNIKTLYEIIAYCLIPDYPIHRIFCFIGGGMNGKSCFLNLLRKFIGGDNCCSTELDTLLQSRFEVSRLHKKLVCQMGETNFSEMSKTSTLKKLSGGDLIGFEYKRKDPFEDVNYAKIIIATNNLPTTTDKTIGFYRRWMIIDFPNQFTEKKDILSDIPDREYNALTTKCCAVLKELLEKREFTNEGSIEDRIKNYEDKSNPLEKFIREFTEEDFDGIVWKNDFAKKLNEWCRQNRFREISDVSIGSKMKQLNIDQKLKYLPWDITKKGRGWVGIKWKNSEVLE